MSTLFLQCNNPRAHPGSARVLERHSAVFLGGQDWASRVGVWACRAQLQCEIGERPTGPGAPDPEARSPRSVQLLKGLQSSREAFQEESARVRDEKPGVAGLSKPHQKLGYAPQLAFACLLPQELENVGSLEPLGLGLKVIRDILLEIFQSHHDAA